MDKELEKMVEMMQVLSKLGSTKLKFDFCEINGKEFDEKLPNIIVSEEKFIEIVNWFFENEHQIKDEPIPLIFTHAVLRCKEHGRNTNIEYELKNNHIYVTYAIDDNIAFKAKYDNDYNIVGGLQYNYQMKKRMGEEFEKFALGCNIQLKNICINKLKAIMWYITSFQNVVTITESDIKSSNTNNRKKNYSKSQQRDNKPIKLTKTIYVVNDTKIEDLKLTENSKIKRKNKSCEYQFTRKGHWAYSHKTGKKWWVSESVVGKDKPQKNNGTNYIV